MPEAPCRTLGVLQGASWVLQVCFRIASVGHLLEILWCADAPSELAFSHVLSLLTMAIAPPQSGDFALRFFELFLHQFREAVGSCVCVVYS